MLDIKQRTILIVDDEQIIRKSLHRLFLTQGFNVLTASSCSSAITIVKKQRPDCMILDFNLGDGTAPDVYTPVRKAETERMPIVIFSGDSSAEECLRGEYTADRFILKSSPITELLTSVEGLLQEQSTQKQVTPE